MKRMICLLCAAMLVTAMCNSTSAINQPSLSELSDEECVAFLEDYGVDIPGSQSEEEIWIPFFVRL